MRITRRPHPILNYLLIALMAIVAAVVLMLLAPTPAHGQQAHQAKLYDAPHGMQHSGFMRLKVSWPAVR